MIGLLKRAVVFELVKLEPWKMATNAFPGPATVQYAPVPKTIRRWCSADKCHAEMDWHCHAEQLALFPDQTRIFAYVCVQCGEKAEFALNLLASNGVYEVVMVGCWPAPLPVFSDDLKGGLGEIGEHLYSNALACRASGRGIGAVTYARRTVEREMDSLLDLLHELLLDNGDALPLARVAELKATKSFETKARHADAVLPPSLFPGQQNPFATLHDLLSDGVHNLDDVESCDRFDECRALLELLFERLNRERESKRLYEDGVKRLKPRATRLAK